MDINDIPEISDLEQPPAPSRGLSLGSIILIFGVICVIAVVGMQFANQNASTPTSGPAPTFTVTTFDGETFDLKAQAGKITVLNFWGSWCGPCRAEAPRIQLLHEDYAERGVNVLGVTYLDDVDNSLAFMNEYGLTFPSAPDPNLQVADSYQITGAPETFIIDQNGDVVDFVYGEITDLRMTQLRDLIDDMLANG
ncbi:MAG: TlpA disulfide reductase family protein [Aggregatilineales bacterium]